MTEHVLAEIETRVQNALAASPIYALRELRVERQHNSSLRLHGLVASFYHKQLAQEVARSLAANVEVINLVSVCSEQERVQKASQ
jgi:osmotically-inducible protein OsmY